MDHGGQGLADIDVLASVRQALGTAQAGVQGSGAPRSAPQPARPAAARPAVPHWRLPGLTARARVTTSFGDLPIEALRLRDELRTPTGQFVRVQRIEQIRLDAAYLRRHPEAQPYLIRAGSLAPNEPRHDMLISPGQEVSYGTLRFQRRFRAVAEIAPLTGVSRHPEPSVTYFLIDCGGPATIFVEGIATQIAPPA